MSYFITICVSCEKKLIGLFAHNFILYNNKIHSNYIEGIFNEGFRKLFPTSPLINFEKCPSKTNMEQPITALQTLDCYWLLYRLIDENFSKLTFSSQIFRNDFVYLHYHLWKISSQTIECILFSPWSLYITNNYVLYVNTSKKLFYYDLSMLLRNLFYPIALPFLRCPAFLQFEPHCAKPTLSIIIAIQSSVELLVRTWVSNDIKINWYSIIRTTKPIHCLLMLSQSRHHAAATVIFCARCELC